MDTLETKILIGIAVMIFLIFIYTLFFFSWSKDIKIWTKQKNIHAILKKYITKNKSTHKLNKAFDEIKNLFKDKQENFALGKMYNILNEMTRKKDKGDKYLIESLLSKMQTEHKYFAVSKNSQILFENIDAQLTSANLNKQQLQMDITLVYNKISELERDSIYSKKGYWVGLVGLIISVISTIYSIIK